MENAAVRYYEFGEFRLDVRRRILLKSGEQIALSSRICDLLLVLLQNEGKTLTHDDLLDSVWEGAFVEQSNLKKSISSLRHILGERPNESQFIKTVPRRGYAFVAPVTTVPEDPDQASREYTHEMPAEKDDPGINQAANIPLAKIQKKSRGAQVAIAGIAFGILAIAGWYAFSTRSVRFSIENVQVQRLTTDGNFYDSSVSPDGNYLVHTMREGKTVTLTLHQLATGRSSRLVSYSNVSFWAYQFTPDGNFVYFIVKNWGEPDKTGIYRIPFLGGEEKLIYASNGGGGLTFSPDGKQFAFQSTDNDGNPEILAIAADGTAVRRVIGFEPSTRLWSLKFSPDGKSLLFVIRRETAEQKNVYAVKSVSVADSKETIVIPEQDRVIHSALWMPDQASMILLVREPNAEIRQIWQYFPGSGEWSRVTNDDDSYTALNLLGDGTSIVATRESTSSSIWTAEGDPYNFRQVTGGLNQYGKTNWTGDGRLVYLSVENKAEIVSIMSDAGRNKHALTPGNEGMWLEPTISGDGRWIVYLSNQSGSQQLWRMSLDGSIRARLTSSGSPIFNGRLLSDGQTVIFQKYVKPTGWCLFKQVGDAEAKPITESQISAWDLAPDETRIATWFEDPVTKKWKVVIIDLITGQIIRTVDGLDQNILRWTRDGKGLAYVSVNEDISEIRILNLEQSVPAKTVATVQADNIFWFDWSRDGSKLVLVRGKRLADAVMISVKKG